MIASQLIYVGCSWFCLAPIMAAVNLAESWLTLPGMDARGASGRLVIGPVHLGRQDLAFNWELIAMAINWVGCRPGIEPLTDQVEDYLHATRCRGKAPATRDLASIAKCSCQLLKNRLIFQAPVITILAVACLSSGDFCKAAAWRVRNLITLFVSIAKRPHRPRERNIRRIFKEVNIPIPGGPRLQSQTHGCVSACTQGCTYMYIFVEYI